MLGDWDGGRWQRSAVPARGRAVRGWSRTLTTTRIPALTRVFRTAIAPRRAIRPMPRREVVSSGVGVYVGSPEQLLMQVLRQSSAPARFLRRWLQLAPRCGRIQQKAWPSGWQRQRPDGPGMRVVASLDSLRACQSLEGSPSVGFEFVKRTTTRVCSPPGRQPTARTHACCRLIAQKHSCPSCALQ